MGEVVADGVIIEVGKVAVVALDIRSLSPKYGKIKTQSMQFKKNKNEYE